MIGFSLFATFGASVAIGADPAGDAVAGKAAFAQCSGCHSLAPGANGIGPSLNGVVGRPVASVKGYAYSQALQSGRDKAWTIASLQAYLASPNAMFPGNKMGIPVADPKRRANIVAYLAQTKGK